MGDSRSWAADMEDEVVTCEFGVERGYFEMCTCEGCTKRREHVHRAVNRAKAVYHYAQDVFINTPEEDWDKIKSIKVK